MTDHMDMENRPHIDRTVIEIWIGIWIFTAFCFIVSIWFVKHPAAVAVGFVLGALLGCASVWHMWHTLDRSLGLFDEKRAAKNIGGGYLIRYLTIILLVALLYFTHIGDPFAAFIAYLGIKPAAYLQPRIHRALCRKMRQEEH